MTRKQEGGEGLFVCPICSSPTYSENREHNGIRGPKGCSWVVDYICDGCSVKFADPEKFFSKRGVPYWGKNQIAKCYDGHPNPPPPYGKKAV